MFKKTFSVVSIALLLLSIIVLAFNVQPAKADAQAVVINANGSITPIWAPITTSDNITYSLTNNITYPTYYGIVVQRGNIVVDGKGYTVQGNQSGEGISIRYGNDSVTIKNTNVKSFYCGIVLDSSHNTAVGNNVTGNYMRGIFVFGFNNTVIGNNVTGNAYGIWLAGAQYCTIVGNNVTANDWNLWAVGDSLNTASHNTFSGNNVTASNCMYAIYFEDNCHYNTFTGNNITANHGSGFCSWGDCSFTTFTENNITANDYDGIDDSDGFFDTIIGNNVASNGLHGIVTSLNSMVIGNNATANGRYGIWVPGGFNTTVSGNNATANYLDGIHLDSAENCTVSGNNVMSNSYNGINFTSSSNNTVSGNDVMLNYYNGMNFTSSSNNTVTGNNVASNGCHGIYLSGCLNNTVAGNNATGNNYYGILLDSSSSNNTVARNNATANGDGISLRGHSGNNTVAGNDASANNYYGIYLQQSSSNNTVARNTASANNYYGILLLSSSSNNTITGNSVKANGYGIGLLTSSNTNSIFHNSFVQNSLQAYVDSSCSANVWDNGYPSGGNYWSNYTGVDLKSGPYQNLTGSDGIGDTNHTLNAGNVDRYPLVHAYGSVQNLNTSLIYLTIQSAISAAETLNGHIIYVRQGTYVENVIVSKSVSLLGEDMETTIINGNTSVPVVQLWANGVSISGFTIHNGTYGITIGGVKNCTVSGNKVTANQNGIYLYSSLSNTVVGNNASENSYYGIFLYLSSNTMVVGNNVTTNSEDGIFLYLSSNNTVAENNVTTNSFEGVYLQYSSNNTVSGNIVMANSRHGIELDSSSNNTVNGNSVFSNLGTGLELYYSSNNNTVTANNLTANNRGIAISASSNASRIFHNNIAQNTVQAYVESSCSGNVWDNGYPSGGNYWSNYTGVDLKSGPYQNLTGSDGIGDTNQTIDANNVDHYPLMRAYGSVQNLNTSLVYLTIQSAISAAETQNGHVIYVKQGTYAENVVVTKSISLLGEDMETTIINGNTTLPVVQISSSKVTISGFTIQNGTYGIYINGVNNCTVSENKLMANSADGIRLQSSSYGTASGNNVTGNNNGIYLSSSSYGTVSGNDATGNGNGIVLVSSSNSTIAGNNATANSANGIYVHSSLYSTVSGNNATGNSVGGIFLYLSSNSTVTGNNATANNAATGSYGIRLDSSSNSTVSGNNATGNINGIVLVSSSNSTVAGNSLAANSRGIYIVVSSNTSRIFHNNFVQNTVQATIDLSCLGNAWDNGYPSGGNYWSNYTGPDLFSGPYQNVTGTDGIGDNPHPIDASNMDHYPLMGPYSTSLLTVAISPSSTTLRVGQSQPFTSTISGGTVPYTYQWYLNAIPVQGAVFSNWTFTPTSGGSYTIYVKVNDNIGTQLTSNIATATVSQGGGGGGRTSYCS